MSVGCWRSAIWARRINVSVSRWRGFSFKLSLVAAPSLGNLLHMFVTFLPRPAGEPRRVLSPSDCRSLRQKAETQQAQNWPTLHPCLTLLVGISHMDAPCFKEYGNRLWLFRKNKASWQRLQTQGEVKNSDHDITYWISFSQWFKALLAWATVSWSRSQVF